MRDILKFFVQLINAKLVIEIGTSIGYSTAYMAEGLSTDGKIFSIEKNLQHFEIAKSNIIKHNLDQKIIVLNEDANAFWDSKQEKVDLIFIDGKKLNIVII